MLTLQLGKNKGQYVANIMSRSNTIHRDVGQVEQVENFIKTRYFSGVSSLHQMYVTRFNAVDLGDRYYAKVGDGHRVHNWHTKMFFAILKLGTVNCYVQCISNHYQDWIDFRCDFGAKLALLTTIE
jgi:hypothetical protein